MSLQSRCISFILKGGKKRLIISLLLLLNFPPKAITSNDEMGKAGRLASEWAGGSVVTKSFLEASPVFFFDKRPLTMPPLAFFSWASSSFCLLNLVVILERTKNNIKKEKERERKEEDKKKEALTLLYNFQILPNLSRWFQTQKVKK